MYDLGILGGGQLARMTALSARASGLSTLVLDPDPGCSASSVAAVEVGSLDDGAAIRRVADRVRGLTLENEFVPARLLEGIDVVPGAATLATIQDKLLQRRAYAAAGLPSPRAVPLARVAEIGFPCVLKARFGGYDGKGVRFADDASALEGLDPNLWLAEERVDFERELSVMVFCASEGEAGGFPAMVTEQVDGVCDLVFPAEDQQATAIARKAIGQLGWRGLFGVELFETQTGEILINEIAPRPHNSGHYTQDWGGVSQFEIHWRLALGYAGPHFPAGAPTGMANVLGIAGAGDSRDGLRAMLAVEPWARLHWYDKINRAGRKMGHINVAGEDCRARVIAARAAFLRGWAQGV